MVTEIASDLEEEAGEIRLEERLATLMAMALARLLREAEESPGGANQVRTILDIARQLSQLRRESHQAERVRLERERWEQKEAEICEKERQEAEEEAQKAAIWEQVKAEFAGRHSKGAGKADRKPPRKPRGCSKAKARVARPHPGPPPQEREVTEAAPGEAGELGERSIEANQAQSSPIKVNQGCEGGGAAPKEAGGVQPGETQSNPVKPGGPGD
jgi:hypothetical protein